MITTTKMMAVVVLASITLNICLVAEPVFYGSEKSEVNPAIAARVIDATIKSEANPEVAELVLTVPKKSEVNPESAVRNFYGAKEGATTQEYYDQLRGMHPSRSFEQDQFSLDLIKDKKSGKIDGVVKVFRWTYKGINHVHAMVKTSAGGWQGPQPAEGYYGAEKWAEDFEIIQ